MEVDQEWVPYSQEASLYIRPTFIGTEVRLGVQLQPASSQTGTSWFGSPDSTPCVPQPSLGVSRAGKAMIFVIIGPVGPYFATGSFNPVSLLADPSFVRAWEGGVGAFKMGG